MQLKLVSGAAAAVVHVANSGPITGRDVNAARKNPLEDMLGTDWVTRKIMLDLADTPYIDSAGVGWLLKTQSDLKKSGGLLVVHSVVPAVANMLKLLKIGSVIPMRENEQAARETLTAEAPAAKG